MNGILYFVCFIAGMITGIVGMITWLAMSIDFDVNLDEDTLIDESDQM